MTKPSDAASGSAEIFDVVVVGAGIGGLYGVYRFVQSGLSVVGIEKATDVGGVWHYNRYPGARVDVDSIDYCYHFSEELKAEWKWSERYASQPELEEYLRFVADRFDLRRHIRFETTVTGAQWIASDQRWLVVTEGGATFRCRFLVMATGNLSEARRPNFPGLDDFEGQWVQTSHWPTSPVPLAGRRVAVIGTGSSGVQCAPVLAQDAEHVFVMQRTPNYSVPARNRTIEAGGSDPENGVSIKEELLGYPSGTRLRRPESPVGNYSSDEQARILEDQWAFGGQGMNTIFTDQLTNGEANQVVADFVRSKIRSTVADPGVAESLCPVDHPIGTRRLCLDTDYYATFNRPNVTLVDLRRDPLVKITKGGIATQSAHYAVDLIVFAIGFIAFTGALDQAGIRNDRGAGVTTDWRQGPKTVLGMMTYGFPNLFFPTGPGSPSVLANLFLQNEFQMDWIAECIEYMGANGYAVIEPTEKGQQRWTEHVAELASRLLRKQIDNYMVHVNGDGSRVFIPYSGGLDRYVREAREIASKGYDGFSLR